MTCYTFNLPFGNSFNFNRSTNLSYFKALTLPTTFSCRAAVKFYRIGNTERMLSAIESFPKMSDRVDFLEKRGFVTEAARILESNGN